MNLSFVVVDNPSLTEIGSNIAFAWQELGLNNCIVQNFFIIHFIEKADFFAHVTFFYVRESAIKPSSDLEGRF